VKRMTTPLHVARFRGHLDVVVELLDPGDAFHANDSNGTTTSILRKSRGGADINAKDTRDDTPLHWASRKGHLDIVQALRGGDANILAANKLRQPSIHMAVRKGKSAVSKYLLQQLYATSHPLPLHELLEDLTWIRNPNITVGVP
jgi:ankyrin repeat protein